jgi:sarcosine oxidase subunit beta
VTVVVVGGGVVGLASAHSLADRGADVTLLDRDTVGAENSVRTGGGIRSQFGTAVNVALSRASVPVFERFEAEFGVDILYRQTGYLFLAREESTAAALRENVALQTDHGVDSEYLSPEEAAALCPELHEDAFVGAAHCPTDGYADHHRIVQGFHEAALDAGVDVRPGTAVVDVRVEDGRATGVETLDGAVDADHVVNAAGAWGGEVAAMAGVDVPISPKRRQLMVVDPATPVPESNPWAADLDGGAHFRPDGSGRALVGGILDHDDDPVDADGYSRRFDRSWAETVLARAARVAGYVGPDATIRRGWAGLYAMTPDGHPVIEETIPGLVNAVGFSGHGLMHAPATGQVVAELVLDGEPKTVDVSALTADRFEAGRLLGEDTVF